MKKLMLMVGILALVLAPVMRGQDKGGHAEGDADHVFVRPDAIKWGPAPPGLPPGAQFAVLSGDPGKAGDLM